jgi:hypothetical protein
VAFDCGCQRLEHQRRSDALLRPPHQPIAFRLFLHPPARCRLRIADERFGIAPVFRSGQFPGCRPSQRIEIATGEPQFYIIK